MSDMKWFFFHIFDISRGYPVVVVVVAVSRGCI